MPSHNVNNQIIEKVEQSPLNDINQGIFEFKMNAKILKEMPIDINWI